MGAWRLLLTGPTQGLDRWVEALGQAPRYVTERLVVLRRPVLELQGRALPEPVARPQWLALTSQSALPALEQQWSRLAGVPCAVVGERCAAAVQRHGLELALAPAADVAELLRTWQPLLRPGQRVLWPRGSESDELARVLRQWSVEVDDPVVYRTRSSGDRRALPAAELVFFASPSAVQAFLGLERVDAERPPVAVAIGETTADALRHLVPHPFAGLEVLARPEPEALIETLVRLRRTAP
jgi:uroporphyrinogen-III synthase